MPINRPATKGTAWGKRDWRRRWAEWKGEGPSQGAVWQLDTELGPELRRVVSGAKRGRGKLQAAAGPELGARKRRNAPDWTAKGLGGGRRGAGPRLRRPRGGRANSRPQPTAGLNRPRVAACELPGLVFLPSLTGFPNLSAPPPDSRSLCAVFLHFSWFVSASAVSFLPPSPRAWSFPRASVSETWVLDPATISARERWRSRGSAQVSAAGRLEGLPKREAQWPCWQIRQHSLGLGNPLYWVKDTPVG